MSKYDYVGLLFFGLIFLAFGPLSDGSLGQSLSLVRLGGWSVAVTYFVVALRATPKQPESLKPIRQIALGLAASVATAAVLNASTLGYAVAIILAVPIALATAWAARWFAGT